MTMRYRQAYPKTDESLDPRDWNNNMFEIASEFNGYLDKDNIPKSVIDLSMVKVGALTKVHSDVYTDTVGNKVTLSDDTSGWQGGDSTNSIGVVSFTTPCDSLLICDFSGRIVSTGGSTDQFIRFRISVDGTTVAVNGFSDKLQVQYNALYLTGAIPVLAGTHTVRVQAQVGIVYNLLQLRGRADAPPEIWSRELVVIERRR